MTFDAHANLALSTIAVPPSPGNSGTTATLNGGDGALMPAVPFNATIWPANAPRPTKANAEIVRVTGLTGDALTFTRTQEGTSARTILAGDQFAATITAKTITDIESVALSGGSGALVAAGPVDLQPAAGPTVSAPNAPAPLTIPTYDGSGNCAEPSVVYVPGGWNGYRFWMCMAPYPLANPAFENASIVASNDGMTWVVPPGVTNPIIPAPGAGSNFDPTLFLDSSGRMWIVNQESNGASSVTQAVSSSDGVHWTSPVTILGPSASIALYNSPCPVWDGTQYRLYVVDINASPYVVKYFTARAITGPWSGSATSTNLAGPAAFGTPGPNHLNIIRAGDKYYAVVYANNNLYFTSSWDGVTWTIPTGPLMQPGLGAAWDGALSRAAFLPVYGPTGMEVALWYGGVKGSAWNIGFTVAQLGSGKVALSSGADQVDSSYQVVDRAGTNLFRVLTSTGWADNVATQYVQVTPAGGNLMVTGMSAQGMGRAGFRAASVQFGDTTFPAPGGVAEWFAQGASSYLLRLHSLGILELAGTQTTLNGTTAGSAVSSMPFGGPSYKKFLVFLNGYQNASGVAQTIGYPVAFTNTPTISQPAGFGATTNTGTLTLPSGMGAPVTGWIVVEGY